MKPTTIVIGAGIIGSGIAYELSRRGHSVLILESLSEGGQTSAASAGMVNPYSGFEAKTFLSGADGSHLGVESLKLYPEWAASLLEETGVDIEWHACGSLQIALSESDEQKLLEDLSRVEAFVPSAKIVSGEEARRMEPLISSDCRAALYLPDEGHVNPQRLLYALRLAAIRLGAELRRGQPVLGFETEGERLIGVRIPGGVVKADWVIAAAGAWTGILLSSLGLPIPIQPVRGLGLLLVDSPEPLRRVVVSRLNYLVPRLDGAVYLGATSDYAEFDMRPTAEGFAHLLSSLAYTFPSLVQAVYAGHAVGLRPGTPDGEPLIGFASPWQNLLIASGHFRHGVLLAPATARAIAKLIAD